MLRFAATPDTVHGAYSRALLPLAAVDAGTPFTLACPDVAYGLEQHGDDGEPRAKVAIEPGARFDGPAMVGPVWINEARPGQFLEISIERLKPASWAWTVAGFNGHNRRWLESLGVDHEDYELVRWTLDGRFARAETGWTVPVAPFFGSMGVCPGGEDWTAGWAPHVGGGNMDCPLLTAGATLTVPVMVPGALFSAGDGHAAQGNGELAGSALECPLEGTFNTRLLDAFPVRQPVIRRGDERAVLGFGLDLDEAAAMAMDGMLALLGAEYDLTRRQGLAFASAAANLHVTQIANGTVGVHVVWRTSALG